MMEDHQTSILDSLQWNNIPLDYETRHNTQSYTAKFYKPHKVLPWKEFTLKTLKSIEGGKLLRVAAETESPLTRYPDNILIPDEGGQQDEPQATTALGFTTWQVVQNALDAVQNKLPTCKWTHSVQMPDKAERQRSAKSTPCPAGSSPWGSPIMSPRHIANIGCLNGNLQRPDHGANIKCQRHGMRKCRMSMVQRLPKEIKPSSWTSDMVIDSCLMEDGTWKPTFADSRDAGPIRQAFTYSVIYDCRYGCILTTNEAFIFQVRLCTPKECSNSRKVKPTREAFSKYGMMEYITFPWSTESHTEPALEDTEQIEIEAVDPYTGCQKTTQIKRLTYNLALWAVHVLAASRHRIQDSYDRLENEKLVFIQCNEPRALQTPESIVTPGPSRRSDTRGRSRSRKRGFDSDQEDEPAHSQVSTSEIFLPSRRLSTPRWSSRSDTEKEDNNRGNDWARTVLSEQDSTIQVRGADDSSDTPHPEDRRWRTKRRKRQ